MRPVAAMSRSDHGSDHGSDHQVANGAITTITTSRTHGNKPITKKKPKAPKFRGIINSKGAVFSWLLLCAIAAACWVGSAYLQSTTALASHGYRKMWTIPCGNPSVISSWNAARLAVVNAAAGLVGTVIKPIRGGLLAPSPRAYRKSQGSWYLDVDSWEGFRSVSWHRRGLYLILLGSWLLVHFLSNSIFFLESSAHNTYIAVVSSEFFNGKPFDLLAINVTRYPLDETPTMPPLGPISPLQYDGYEQLRDSLGKLSRDQTGWTKLTRKECLAKGNEAVYSDFHTIVLVTKDTPLYENNSALAISVLPGYRVTSAAPSLVALCPGVYMAAYPRARVPSETPFMAIEPVGKRPSDITFVSLAEAEAWARNVPASANKRQAIVGSIPMSTKSDYYDPMASTDLCYGYWGQNVRYVDHYADSYNSVYRVPPCPLEECFVAPVTSTLMCDAVYSPLVLFVFLIVSSILLGAATAALALRISRDGLYSVEDARRCFGHGSWYPEFDSVSRVGRRCSWMPSRIDLLNLVVYLHICVLFIVSGLPMLQLLYPPEDSVNGGWLLRALALYKATHILFDIVFFFQNIRVRQRAYRLTYASPELDGWKHGRDLLLKSRSSLIHMVFGLVFITELTGVAPLGADLAESPSSNDAAKLVAFTTLGVPAFNQRSSGMNTAFALFNWIVFIALPSLVVEITSWLAIGWKTGEESLRVMSFSTMVLLVFLYLSIGLPFHVIYMVCTGST
ncbi:hypothetical protein B0T25DRAFT_539379 [Lasiosphaeria hispida]|uniref:Uncharacterized protein n=1 Tax=Lasiosphaeria hispida TaxID=260671 RepID=A0AAJ0HMI9_9PEZI|nr:hypothetical protein B0T25DRAFT_539379 [Lasiosphaeria hispida]